MAVVVYVLCAATSALCATLLWRQYARTRVRLLLWTCLCFVGLALNNAMLVVDLHMVPDVDLSIARQVPALLGVAVLLGGMIWEAR